MAGLDDYLELTPGYAAYQWRGILGRVPRPRQVNYVAVEVILCYGLFWRVDPHRWGGTTMHLAPPLLHTLADLLVRTPGSLTYKMMHLEGAYFSGGRYERSFVAEMITAPRRFPPLFTTVLEAARAEGIDADRLPAFLDFSGGEGSDPVRPGQLIARVERRVARGKQLQLF